MERWEEELVQQLRAAERRAPEPTPPPSARAPDPLLDAFHTHVERISRSVAHIAEAIGQPIEVSEEREAGRYQWMYRGRRLRARLDREAQKFFLSVESDAGLDLCELWLEEGALTTDSDGAARPTDPARVVQHVVSQLFRV